MEPELTANQRSWLSTRLLCFSAALCLCVSCVHDLFAHYSGGGVALHPGMGDARMRSVETRVPLVCERTDPTIRTCKSLSGTFLSPPWCSVSSYPVLSVVSDKFCSVLFCSLVES